MVTQSELNSEQQEGGSVKQLHRALNPSTRLLQLPGRFNFFRGGELKGVEIAFETWGELNSARDNAILLFTGLSPSAHAASSKLDAQPGWWEYMVGHGHPIDTNRYYVICVNSLGSCFGSSGPSSIDPSTGEPYRLTFPDLSIEDIATAAHEALKVLGIRHLHSVVGASLGGMSALAYALYYPDEIDSLVSLCATSRALPFAIAIRSLQREIIRQDPDWEGGDYPIYHEPVKGMRLARKLGLISYRSSTEWSERFGRSKLKPEDQGSGRFSQEYQIESYLEANAERFVGTFDANSYLYLSQAMDRFDISEHGQRLENLSRDAKQLRALVIGVETDLLFPLQQQREIADTLSQRGVDVTFKALSSIQGHDAFLVDKEQFAPVVESFFK